MTLGIAAALLFAAAVGTAYGFAEGVGQPWGVGYPGGADCVDCHGLPSSPISLIQNDRSGPHGGFLETGDDCDSCHRVHEAASPSGLLLAPTVFATCNSCHDLSFTGTGGSSGGGGVYGAIRARGEVVRARHDIDGYNNTDTVPVDGSKGYDATIVIPGSSATLTANLSCSDCHTPHGNTVMQPFEGGRWRMNAFATTISSTHILQDDVGGAPKGTYAMYGAYWCAACHDRRHSDAPGVSNHPVDRTDSAYLDTSMSAQGLRWYTTATVDGTLPDRLAGFSREATPGWAPMCQQCHNNRMDVEAPLQMSIGVHMGGGASDGRVATDNPRFQLFPHESVAEYFQVETGDDLCLNCHPTTLLP